MGWKLGVCARCASIYFSFTAVAVFLLLSDIRRENHFYAVVFRHSRMILIFGVLPMVIDVVLNDSGIHGSTLLSRGITGCCFGALSALVLAPQIPTALLEIFPQLLIRPAYVQKTR